VESNGEWEDIERILKRELERAYNLCKAEVANFHKVRNVFRAAFRTPMARLEFSKLVTITTVP